MIKHNTQKLSLTGRQYLHPSSCPFSNLDELYQQYNSALDQNSNGSNTNNKLMISLCEKEYEENLFLKKNALKLLKFSWKCQKRSAVPERRPM